MKPRHLFLAALLLLGACASAPTLYQAAAGPGAVGYSESPIENDRWRVTFHGGPGARVPQVGELALQRAAELALQHGYDWFEVTEREVENDQAASHPSVSLGLGGGDFGGGAAFGGGAGVGFDLSRPAPTVTIEVLMGRGAVPREPDAYDARQVRRAMGQPV